jgi:hypothetical protein
MTSIEYSRILLPLLLLGSSLGNAHADGGVIRLREAQGPFLVTIFTTDDLVQDRTADVSVMVQRRDSSEAVLDATVNLMFSAPTSTAWLPPHDEQLCGMAGAGLFAQASGLNTAQFTAHASRKLASNKLLYAVPVKFGAVGIWRLEASIQHEANVVTVVCSVPVGPAAHGFVALIPYAVLPPLAAALFAVNQCLRKYDRGRCNTGFGKHAGTF